MEGAAALFAAGSGSYSFVSRQFRSARSFE
jgi:hypothetical protein